MFNLPVHYSHSNFLGIIKDDVRVADKMPSIAEQDIGDITGVASLEMLSNRTRRPWNGYWCPSDIDGLLLQQSLAWSM